MPKSVVEVHNEGRHADYPRPRCPLCVAPEQPFPGITVGEHLGEGFFRISHEEVLRIAGYAPTQAGTFLEMIVDGLSYRAQLMPDGFLVVWLSNATNRGGWWPVPRRA